MFHRSSESLSLYKVSTSISVPFYIQKRNACRSTSVESQTRGGGGGGSKNAKHFCLVSFRPDRTAGLYQNRSDIDQQQENRGKKKKKLKLGQTMASSRRTVSYTVRYYTNEYDKLQMSMSVALDIFWMFHFSRPVKCPKNVQVSPRETEDGKEEQ